MSDSVLYLAGATIVVPTTIPIPLTPFPPGATLVGLPSIPLACFAAGTAIDALAGPVQVENLARGDMVTLARGGSAPVIWVGHRRVDCRSHPDPHRVWPVRVKRGAFADDTPRRDLVLSPDHAIFAEGVLVPIRYLVNSRTIVQERRDRVTYYHVELPRHDVILAEAMPVESYLETGGRSAFDNGGPVIQLHPDFARHVWEAEGCAPLVVTGPEFQHIARMVAQRARRLRQRDKQKATRPG